MRQRRNSDQARRRRERQGDDRVGVLMDRVRQGLVPLSWSEISLKLGYAGQAQAAPAVQAVANQSRDSITADTLRAIVRQVWDMGPRPRRDAMLLGCDALIRALGILLEGLVVELSAPAQGAHVYRLSQLILMVEEASDLIAGSAPTDSLEPAQASYRLAVARGQEAAAQALSTYLSLDPAADSYAAVGWVLEAWRNHFRPILLGLPTA